MAGANSPSVSFLRPAITIATASKTTPNRLLLFAHMATPSKPAKLARRRNTLRPKILKTTPKPYQNPETPETPLQEISPIENDSSGENDEFRGSEVVNDGISSEFEFSGKSFLRYGLYFVGVFVFQTILTVWMLGNTNSDKQVGGSGRLESKGKVLLNGNEKIMRSNVDMGEKIEEIRVMASKARKTEKYKDENLNSGTKIRVEKEIEKRLLRLQKGLDSTREKLPKSYVNYLSKYGKVEDEVNKKEEKKIISLDTGKGNESLMFKKKLKFRSPSTEEKEGPKGFGDYQNHKVLKGKRSGLGGRDKMVEMAKEVSEGIQKERDVEENDGRRLVIQKSRVSEDEWKNAEEGMRRENNREEASRTRKSRNGNVTNLL